MYCSKCGFQLKDDANFCLKCGAKNINNNSIKPEKVSTYDLNNATKDIKTTSKNISTKKPKTLTVIVFGVVLALLSVGFVSYYISLSKFSSSTPNPDKTTTKNTVTPNTNKSTDSKTKSDATATTNETDKNKINSPTYYIFSKSGDENLLDSDVSKLNKETLPLARNEIFARHGFIFKTEPFKSYFNNKSWYKQNPNFKGTDAEFNASELYNVQLILKYEKK